MDDKILRRIKKCLALAKSSNPHEAAAALRQAQKLMKKHGVSADQVELSDVGQATRRAGRAEKPPLYTTYLIHTICKAFGVLPMYAWDGPDWLRKRTVHFIGINPAPELAGYAYDVLLRQLRRDRNSHYKELHRHKRANRIRRSDIFAEQWVHAVYERVAAFARTSQEEDLTRRALAALFPDAQPITARAASVNDQRDMESGLAGAVAGKRAQLNQGLNPGAAPQRLGNK